jgi:hypothetical protein
LGRQGEKFLVGGAVLHPSRVFVAHNSAVLEAGGKMTFIKK